MQIQIRDHNVRIQPDQRAKLQRRLSHALRAHANVIELVTVYMDDSNRGFGPGEKHCRVSVKLPGEAEMYANASHRQIDTVIELAAEHIRQVVDRQFKRKERLAELAAATPAA